LSENKNALLIPSNAIIPQEDSKNIIVARAGKAHFVKVKTGIRQATNVEITEGIQFGDTIITSGIQFLKEDGILRYTTISSTL
jgi:membrane fusion protein (multidrug efflux system)